MGCGPGFLSNELSKAGHNVTAVDFSTDELSVAEMRDETRRVKYIQADLYKLPFPSSSFDVVTGLDWLEHLSNPSKLLLESSRVLHPGGLFFFNSHSKNFLSYLCSIKGPQLLVKDAQRNPRTYALFTSPQELEHHLDEVALEIKKICGLRPALMQRALWQMLFHRKVTAPFRYTWSRWSVITFLGYAKKLREH
ncbi:Ubiquinone biosynthesis O-methyltransferase [compost metagenome]